MSTVGFKPVGVFSLRSSIDHIVNDLPAGKLYGEDALRLCDASPMTDRNMAELIAPVYFLTYSDRALDDVVVMRSGSEQLSNRRLRVVTNNPHLLQRNEINRQIDANQWKTSPTAATTTVEPRNARSTFAEEIGSAFTFLRDAGAELVVCEGAGRWLPRWTGCPVPDFVLYVGQFFVNVFYGPTDAFRRLVADGLKQEHELFRSGSELYFERREVIEYNCCPSAKRDAYSEQLLASLIADSGVPLPTE
ncbi:MAG: hypothetical protein DWQ08_02390 [Proteobacteria bacterium]|nr:MAG: hypothetical protein DWQ08_02390 [Pseudomonadota bacterium]